MRDKDSKNLAGHSIFLVRHNKLKEIESVINTRHIYMFTAAPGQGKTTFALQMAEKFYNEYIYYQISNSDKDPVFFCKNLYTYAKEKFPKLSCPDFEEAREQDTLDPLLYDAYIKEIIRSLKKLAKRRTALIIDDAHLLPSIGLSCKSVQSAVSMASSSLHFVICSRKDCRGTSRPAKNGNGTYSANNSFFRLTSDEFRELCTLELDDFADFTGLEQIYSITEGWAYGVSRAFEYIKNRREIPDMKSMVELLGDYFRSLLTEDKDNKNYKTLLQLSYLEEINIGLAIQHQGNTKIAEYLIYLLDNNNFIYRVNSSTLSLHKLYAAYLIERSKEEITKLDMEMFLNQAADFELADGNLMKAVVYLTKARTYSRLEQIIKGHIDYFITAEDNEEIFAILSGIPVAIFRNSIWMPLAYAITIRNISPEKAGSMFGSILKSSEDQKNSTVTLMCCSGLIFYHFIVDGDIEKGMAYFDRISELLAGSESNLSPAKLLTIYTSVIICLMNCSNQSDVKTYLEKASAIAERLNSNLYRFILSLLFAVYYENSSQRKLTTNYLDRMLSYSKHLNMNISRFLYTYMSLCRHFFLNGYSPAQEGISVRIRQKTKLYINHLPFYKARLDIMDTDNALRRGDITAAQKFMDTYSTYDIDLLPAYTASLLYGYKALLSAVGLMHSKAQEYTTELLRLGLGCGSNYYHTGVTYLFAGAVYTLAGKFRMAENNLQQALEQGSDTGNDIVCASANAYLSYLHSGVGNTEYAREHAAAALKFMRKRGNHCFWIALPDIMQNLFRCSRSDVSVSDYAGDVAQKHFDTAFDTKGNLIPVMKINAFGEMQISMGDTTISSESLSGSFRIMAALILSSKNFSIHQEVIQASLWPSSNKEHARKSFDNLMSRFRKIIKDNFRVDPKNYITMSNGIVKLINTRCNAVDFISMCAEAWEFYERGEYVNCLKNIYEVKDIYEDRYFPFITGIEKVDARRQYADRAFIEMISLIYHINKYLPDMLPLDDFFSEWLEVYIHETDMVQTAYKYYKSRHDTVKCFKMIKNYTDFLTAEGFSPQEVNDLVFTIKSGN